MLALTIRKEILSHILSLRFTVTFILFLGLIFASIYVTVNEHQLSVKRYSSRVRVYRDNLDDILAEKQDWGTHGRLRRLFWNEGKSDAVPVAELSWLSQGLGPILPAGINATRRRAEDVDQGLTRNPLLGLLSVPDFAYVVNIVLSLLAILFMFDAICGEKEAGTLRLMLSNSIPRHTILMSKWIGGYIVLMIPFLIASIAGIAYAWTRGVFEVNSDNLTRIGLLIALACLYIAVFFNLSMFISTITHNSATALLICLLVWVIFTLAIPNLAPVTAKIIEPTPTLQKIEAEKQAVSEEIRLKISSLTSSTGELGYGEKIKHETEKLEKERDRRQRRWDRFYEKACNRQMSLAQTLGRLSPSASWIYACTSLTGTGPTAYLQLAESKKRYASAFSQFWEDFRNRKGEFGNDFNPIRADELPILKLTDMNVSKAIKESLNDILLLSIVNILFFMLAFVFFLRYDVR